MRKKTSRIRYAVVGQGYIAQSAVLPAFQNCRKSELTALVSGDREKLNKLGRKYRVKNLFSYEEYDDCLRSGLIDAVYIALPNHLHSQYTVTAAYAGVHVLCEKPMAVTATECRQMIEACDSNGVKLMIAYRLHFEGANLKAQSLIHQEKKIGEPRIYQSIHSQPTQIPNVRALPILQGGGPTYDVGLYDINAARSIFRSEPISVLAQAVSGRTHAFKNIEESMGVLLKFPKERLANFICSFGTVKADRFRVVGSSGELSLDPAFSFVGEKILRWHDSKRMREIVFRARDQFSPEMDYFSECILSNRKIGPSGLEGLADVQVIEAIHESARLGRVVEIGSLSKKEISSELTREMERPPVEKPELFHAESPTKPKAA